MTKIKYQETGYVVDVRHTTFVKHRHTLHFTCQIHKQSVNQKLKRIHRIKKLK